MTDTCANRVKDAMESRGEDFLAFMNYEPINEPCEGEDPQEQSYREFCDYGLSFDYVSSDTFECQDEGYYRYQLSWGGPSDELRFFEGGRIEYWFMDWFDGACIPVTQRPWAKWLVEQFEETELIDWASVAEDEG